MRRSSRCGRRTGSFKIVSHARKQVFLLYVRENYCLIVIIMSFMDSRRSEVKGVVVGGMVDSQGGGEMFASGLKEGECTYVGVLMNF